MKMLLSMGLFALLVLTSHAQISDPEAWHTDRGRIRYLCSTKHYDLYQFWTARDEYDVSVYAYNTVSYPYIGYSSGGIWHDIYFAPHKAQWESTDWVELIIDGDIVAMSEIISQRPCNFPTQEIQLMNECLNIDPASVGLPNEGVFTIDGNNYPYADNLSFFVPVDAVWRWDFWANGVHVFSFEQTDTHPCHIIEGE